MAPATMGSLPPALPGATGYNLSAADADRAGNASQHLRYRGLYGQRAIR